MDDNPDALRQQIDQTKDSLVGKLEALESKVAGTVQSASDTVSETVTAVKNTVDSVVDKVQSAGEFFNIKAQAQRRPWAVFGTSVLIGCMASYLLTGKRKSARSPRGTFEAMGQRTMKPAAGSTPLMASSEADHPQSHPEPKEEKEHGWLREQIDGFLGLAVGSVMGLVRDVAVQELPEAIGKKLATEVNNLTTHLGGKPIEEPILHSEKQPAA